jgi:hypothetical protein
VKRTVIARKTPLRARFRHDDGREERERERREARKDYFSGLSALTDVERPIMLMDVDGTEFAVEPPVGSTRFGPSRREQRRIRKLSRYKQRERFPAYMMWVKAQPCLMSPHGGCSGVIEADHAGLDRGIGQKAHDNTCVPLCSQHHHDRHNFTGPFKNWTQERMRAWRELAIRLTQQAAQRAGVVVP